jgi:hypothetical protein
MSLLTGRILIRKWKKISALLKNSKRFLTSPALAPAPGLRRGSLWRRRRHAVLQARVRNDTWFTEIFDSQNLYKQSMFFPTD